ncbi:MAG: hypothetical protein P4L56_19695 [Candidatus Sulfopaludibacter sp.]|nr:hypothetical protein [Candidatus Sulfopaludibacter sp.]
MLTLSELLGNVFNRDRLIARLAIGLPVAVWAGGILQSQLFGVRNGDPLILATAAAALIACAALAALVPARRATTIDSMQALRAE